MAAQSPKIPASIGGAISGFDQHKLKHADTQEKNVLPTKQGQYPYEGFLFMTLCSYLI